MSDEVMILGATGRTGRAIAAGPDAQEVPLVLFGRNRARLQQAASALSQTPRPETGSRHQLFPSGDLLTAWRDSGAANVVSGSSEVPAGVAIRYALPALALPARSPACDSCSLAGWRGPSSPSDPGRARTRGATRKSSLATAASARPGCALERRLTSRPLRRPR